MGNWPMGNRQPQRHRGAAVRMRLNLHRAALQGYHLARVAQLGFPLPGRRLRRIIADRDPHPPGLTHRGDQNRLAPPIPHGPAQKRQHNRS